MRTRSGFVSNSSSASFIVNVKLPVKELYGFLVSAVEEHFMLGYLIEYLKEQKNHFEKQQEKFTEFRKEYGCADWSWMIDNLGKYIENLTRLKEEIDSKETEEVDTQDNKKTLQDLKLNYIKEACTSLYLGFSPMFDGEDNDTWRFQGGTSMYNGIGDIPHVLRDIVSACIFCNVKVNTEINDVH